MDVVTCSYLMFVMVYNVFAGSELILKSMSLSEQHGRETIGGYGKAG